MRKSVFTKSFTQQEPIPESGIARAVEVMRSGRLHRYNIAALETAETSLLESEFAASVGKRYCLACASGGYALHIALKAAGMRPGDAVLTNAFTLAPVPGAIDNAGGKTVLVEINADYTVDLEHLERMAKKSRAKFFLLSHMRGHIADMDAVAALCERHGVTLIEDCAHAMGAYWNQRACGDFGKVACFSTQTYKHLNSGEGGLLTTDDAQIIARAIVYSGSYMFYARHKARPDAETFDAIRLDTPNYSGRMDNLRAAILRAQLPELKDNCKKWNARYRALEERLGENPAVQLPKRPPQEAFVGSSLQFRAEAMPAARIANFIDNCAARGVELKWFGAPKPHGFTSRYDSWRYLKSEQRLPKTLAILATTFDLRIPLTFSVSDMTIIGDIINEEVAATLEAA